MIIIAAMTRERVIGLGRGMPWDLPDEYQHFRDTIRDQTIIMGRTSYEIFGKDLTTAHTVVVTRSLPSSVGPHIAGSPEEAVNIAHGFGTEVFIGGGASIYEHLLPQARRMMLSFVHASPHGDTYFPAFDPDDWQVELREDRGSYEYVQYVRR